MRSSDWSSDVCSSDLEAAVNVGALAAIVAMRAGEAGAAIEAARRRVAVRLAATMARLDRTRREACGHRAADTLDIPCHGALPKAARGGAQRGFRESGET